jgi:hypothetical protein
MRLVKDFHPELGAIDISKITFNHRSRDDIPQVLRGLQHIYTNVELRNQVFDLLDQNVNPKKNKNNGRPGMELWRILVLGCLKLSLNADYDRICELANEHTTLRQMLGHSDKFSQHEYQLQTIKDNVKLLTPELLEKINQIVVNGGHAVIDKKKELEIFGRCDSFVVLTNIHYPTDINLLYDATRKIISVTAKICEAEKISGFRQSEYNIKCFKQAGLELAKLIRYRRKAKTVPASANNKAIIKAAAKALAQDTKIKTHCTQYTNDAQMYLDRMEKILLKVDKVKYKLALIEIDMYKKHALRQIKQINDRIVLNQVIPEKDKVYSIFKVHSEWIVKGKAGILQELGVRVGVVEDQYGFVLHHQVMAKSTDEKVAVSMVEATKKKYPGIKSVSFDRGFYSPDNVTALTEMLERVALPKKGKLSKEEKEKQNSEGFKKAKKGHSAVESAINALGVHGLDKCRDYGIEGFKKYVALAVLARNLTHLGSMLIKKEHKLWQKRRNRQLRAREAAKDVKTAELIKIAA